jgi:hypothetical protein
MHSIGIAGLFFRPKSRLISAGAIWHAYVHFMPLSDSKVSFGVGSERRSAS